jgi:hypothetical protein
MSGFYTDDLRQFPGSGVELLLARIFIGEQSGELVARVGGESNGGANQGRSIGAAIVASASAARGR